MLSTIKNRFATSLQSNQQQVPSLSPESVIKIDSFGFAEFPSPDDTSKQLLPIYVDPEEDSPLEQAEIVPEGSGISKLTHETDFMEYWMPDRLCKVCYSCEDPFTMFRRRHHCRMCGQVFCNQCSSYYMEGQLINLQGLVRCCKLCFEQMERESKLSKKRNIPMSDQLTPTAISRSVENESYMKTPSDPSIVLGNRRGSKFIDASRSTLAEDPVERVEYANILQNRASAHLEAIVNLLVNESAIKQDTELWESTIISLIREVVSAVDPDAKDGDSIDIRNYVKLKIIPGGLMEESVFIDGIVFRKNVSHKKMMYDKNEVDPKILLLAGGIDFQRMDMKLSSMDTLIEQEDKYMEILVEKIMSLKPDLILVGKSVSRRAQELFCKYRVVVMQNVKLHLLESISRLSGAKVLPSTDHMIQQSGQDCLGTCHKFSLRIIKDDPEKMEQQKPQRILRTRIARGTTYAYLEGCPSEKGCTIVLRGGSRDILNEVKNIISFGVLVAYHLRLEVAYYNDRCAILSPPPIDIDCYNDTTINDDSDDEYMDISEEVKSSDNNNSQRNSISQKNSVTELQDQARRYLLSTSLDVDFSLPYATEIRGITRFRNLKANIIKTSPLDHQVLVITSILMHDTTQRSKSEIKGIKYYTNQDISLGQFLVENCFNMSRNISRDTTMLDQTLSFIHRPGRIEVSVTHVNNANILDENSIAQYLSTRGSNPKNIPIYMSSYCKLCGVTVTPDIPISDETWKISFGKFLEISFYNRTARCRLAKCSHNLRDDHILIFSTEHYVAKFHFIPIHPFSLYVRHSIDFQPQFHLQQSYRFLLNLPQQFAVVVDNFRKSLYLLACETKDVFSGKAVGNEEHQAVLTDISNIDNELQSAVASLTSMINVTLENMPNILDEDTLKGLVQPPPSANCSPSRKANRKSITDQDSRNQDIFNHQDVKLIYPMFHRRQAFMQMMSWNSRIHGLAKYLESVREAMIQQHQQHGHIAPHPTQLSAILIGDVEDESSSIKESHTILSPASVSITPTPTITTAEITSSNLIPIASEPTLLSAESTASSEPYDSTQQHDSTISITVDQTNDDPHVNNFQVNPSDSESLSTSPIATIVNSPAHDNVSVNPTISSLLSSLPPSTTHQQSDNKVKQLGFDLPGTFESIGIPLGKATDVKGQLKTSRITKALARFVMGKDNYEEEENKFDVNFGELGDGRLGMPAGRKGEIIPVLDEEPATIIAYSLASNEYYDLLQEFMREDYEELDSEEEFEPVRAKDDMKTASLPRQVPIEERAGDDMHVDDDEDDPDEDDPELDGGDEEDDANEARDKFDTLQSKPTNSTPRSLAARSMRNAKSKKRTTAVSEALANATSSISSSLMEETTFTTFTANENVFHLNERLSSVDIKSPFILDQSESISTIPLMRDDSGSSEPSSDMHASTPPRPNPEILSHMESPKLAANQTPTSTAHPSHPSTSSKSNPASSSKFDDNRRHQLEKQLLSQRKSHIKHRFEDHDDKGNAVCKFQCQTYWSTQFEAVRAAYLNEDENEQFIRSLSMTKNWMVKGGKSGASFSKSLDDRFVIKNINRVEMQMFLDFAPAYFEYMVKACFYNLPTVLCKILGVYTVGYHNRETGKKVLENVVVMENIFYQRNITGVFDLKGSSRARYLEVTGEKALSFDDATIKRRRARRNGQPVPARNSTTSQVLLDDNLMELTKGRPFPLKHRAKVYFTKAVTNDTLFLRMVDVVDYSILVGFDEESHEVVVGIIDYLRKYDIVKKMERMGKSVGMLTGQAEPTIIQPPQYRNRFQHAMDRYFMTVPDKWVAFDS